MTLLRTKDAKRANDEVRELFRKSIADMFGGENNLPDSVKDAMLLKDYGSGKPLTARRILEVKNAIENLHRVNVFGPETDPEGELAQIALDAGYSRLDFGKLNTAANEGGMATGTSGELPAGVLDKLGKFLAEDPFGAAGKIDKFCTYLENNGPAALHVADGKNVDLNWIYREVIG